MSAGSLRLHIEKQLDIMRGEEMKQFQNEKSGEPSPIARLLSSILAAGIEEAAPEIIIESNGGIAEV